MQKYSRMTYLVAVLYVKQKHKSNNVYLRDQFYVKHLHI